MIKGKINLKGMTAECVARYIILAITLINAVLKMFGLDIIDVDNDTIYTGVSAVAVVVMAIYTAYKNNSITSEAQMCDNLMHNLKEGLITLADIEESLDD